ncbi:DNA repair protein rad10 [Rozella allomycis CSF55]|uniref:DNA repair protein rad10 n=1 Tax=Rozella allomycis (strain CSF55) TaxID=988480 RepID=A0A075AW42_ROZAC|nr:DNA repair protein rad10 domain-containing protein [Rozella allomycis CSF55]RKP20886.1 DNA repair protein rad10 [Rozella allomycis CSF55]|eukprot:EPZ34475.1 DNA repair protein rad10 domain-containing protein [Rozella allomycis CSF55]
MSSILVNPNQKGNGLLKFIRNVPWEYFDDEAKHPPADYILGDTTGAVFLSLQFHRLYPEYIFDRMKALLRHFKCKILLCLVDVKDHERSMKQITKSCLLYGFTLVCAWSNEEAGRYMETFKAYEKKSADMIKPKSEPDFISQLTELLTTIKSVNKTDSLAGIMNADINELAMCSGIGQRKHLICLGVNICGTNFSRHKCKVRFQQWFIKNDVYDIQFMSLNLCY